MPKGYQLDHLIPDRPWICPVRSCRQACKSRQSLAFHFMRVHFGSLLNDNGDGTLTITGYYHNKNGAIRSGKILTPAPPLVTSRIPIDPCDMLPSPKLPKHAATNDTLPQSRLSLEDGPDLAPARRRTIQSVLSLPQETPASDLAGQPDMYSGLVAAGRLQSAAALEMEDWEVAPGRIREEAGEDPESTTLPYHPTARAPLLTR